MTLVKKRLDVALSLLLRRNVNKITLVSAGSFSKTIRGFSSEIKSVLSATETSSTLKNEASSTANTPSNSTIGTNSSTPTPPATSKRLTFAPIPWQRPMSRVISIPKSPARWIAKSAARIAKIKEGLANQAKLIKEHAKQKPPRQMKRGLLQYVKKKSWER